MSKARLTRREVGWLLAQEARGAASALRKGVTQLADAEVEIEIEEGAPLTSTLDVLDDAINLWSELEHSPAGRGRRGRIDIAALLYEVAPGARISIDTGEGTEVFGEENDVRRLLHVLVSHRGAVAGADATTGDVEVRREGDWVHVSVDLGPDLSASEDLERRWLSRMAMRLGGRVELVGSTETLTLPADSASDHVEVEHLKRELQEAQELGESYARELAAVFADLQTRPVPPGISDVAAEENLALLRRTASLLVRSLRPLFTSVRQTAQNLSRTSANAADAATLTSTADRGLELVADLEQSAEIPLDEVPERAELGPLAKDAVSGVEGRARRKKVSLNVSAAPTQAEIRHHIFKLIVRSLVDHAVAATPTEGRVDLALTASDDHVEISVEDGGPPVPASALAELLSQRADPTALGRPGGISLLTARTAVQSQGGSLQIDESPEGRTRVTARIPATL